MEMKTKMLLAVACIKRELKKQWEGKRNKD
jgi:hypothetical protein